MISLKSWDDDLHRPVLAFQIRDATELADVCGDQGGSGRAGGGGYEEDVRADGGSVFFQVEADFGVVNGSLGIEGEVGEWSQ